MKKKFGVLLAGLLLHFTALPQVIGNWNEYLSFTQATHVETAGEKIWCATEGGLFYYNTSDNSIGKLTRLNGLNDFNIQTIKYSPTNQVLLVAYKNSNIDLIYENRIINLSDIKRKSITGDKSINNIFFHEKNAYLSCGFGIVVINLEKQEIKDTYLIGDQGSQIQVNGLTTEGNTIYAATEKGIYFASLDSPNLLDYRNWSQILSIPHTNERFSEIITFNGIIFALYNTGKWGENAIYLKNGNSWESFLAYSGQTENLNTTNKYLAVTGYKTVSVFDTNYKEILKLNSYQGLEEIRENINPLQAAFSETSGLWIADNNLGLINGINGTYTSVYPAGPIDNNAFFLYSNNNDLWVASGGHNSSWNNTWTPPQVQQFRDDSWNYFTKAEIPELNGFWDIVCIVADPVDENHVFAGSWGGGLLEFQDGELINRFTENNSSLQNAIPGQPYVRIGGIDYDSEGNIWVSNADVFNTLSELKADGTWTSYYLPKAKEIKVGQLIVTQNDDKWVVIPRGNNIYVVNKDGSEIEYLAVKSYFNNGETELVKDMNDVYSIAEDQDGTIWVGTSKGVAVYFSPERIWEPGFMYATHPGLDVNDGLYHPLLETETVTAIAVDGANRKWMGTANSGVYLISENGEKEILHFTESDSPLLSNKISSIAINQLSGEVFIGTDKGIVSYIGDAIAGKTGFEEVLVYPNPVRETYDGPVVITGLTNESDVKITDISGNLVYKTTSLGGQATWDGKTLNGNRAKTGIYLIFLSDKTGDQTHIEKLLFIN